MAELKIPLLTVVILIYINSCADTVKLDVTITKAICKQMTDFKASTTIQPALQDKDTVPGLEGCGWVAWEKCPEGKECSSFAHSPEESCPPGGGGGGSAADPPAPSKQPSPPPAAAGGGRGDGSSGTVKAGRIHISGSLSRSLCGHMKTFRSSKKLQEPLNDKDKFASGDTECSWLYWQRQCESSGNCALFLPKRCDEVKVPSR